MSEAQTTETPRPQYGKTLHYNYPEKLNIANRRD